MRCSRCSKFTRIIAGPLTGLLLAAFAVTLTAQPARHSPSYYDTTREVTLSGTVLNVVTQGSRGMTMGSHLLLTTDRGIVDASLGRFGLKGKDAPLIGIGDSVEVTGVIKTLGNKEVLVVRNVKAGGLVYTMRNEHGIPISPQARARAGQQIGQKGDSR
jgi:hypothetical protein